MWQSARMVIFGLIIVSVGLFSVKMAIQWEDRLSDKPSINPKPTAVLDHAIFPISITHEYDIWRGFECLATFTGYRSEDCPENRPNLHTGVDILAEIGTPVLTVSGGTVIYAGPYTNDLQDCQSTQTAPGGIMMPENDYGLQVIIQDGDTVYIYLHLSGLYTTVGTQFERAGEVIGVVGSRGCGSIPHLHFEVQSRGQPIDPIEHLSTINAQ